MKAGIITGFALLWRLLRWTWSILIIGIIVGILGNTAFTYGTTGEMNFKDPRTLAVSAWVNTHLTFCAALWILVLAITLCSYLAHFWQQRKAHRQGHAHEESLIVVAKAVQRALDQQRPQEPALPCWNVPYHRNPFFTGREELLKCLHDNLTSRKAVALTQVISGLGGIGKTQTAVEYAYRHRDEYHDVLWVTAATRETLIASFLDLAHRLSLPEKDEQDQKITVQAVKRWLEQHDQWLLIFDNADDLALAEDFLPTGGKGHLLLTTRAQASGTLAKKIDVEKMDTDEGMLFLLRRAGVLTIEAPLSQSPETDRVAAETIVKEMDGLPLALDQAGAYIEETQCNLADYLSLYGKHRATLLKERGGLVPDHPESVATTWSLSFQRVEEKNPAAADLLRVCAFLHPDAIPEEMITAGAEHLGPHLQTVARDSLSLDKAIAALGTYSLIRRRAHTLTVHRLVQAVLKDTMSASARKQWAKRAVQVVNIAFPLVDYGTWRQAQPYLPHAEGCVSLIEQYAFAFPEAAYLLHAYGRYFYYTAQYEQAKLLFQRTLRIFEQELGPEHLHTAIALRALAQLYWRQGRFKHAEPLYQRALRIFEQGLGPEHPETASTLHQLARLLLWQGRYEQAEPLFQRALRIFEQELGPEHPTTARTLHELARLLVEQGKYEQAEPLFQRALRIFEQSRMIQIDPDLYGFQRALHTSEQRLGPEHPSTASILRELAWLLVEQGKYEQAEPLYQRALRIFEQGLGPEHPETASTLHQLASLYQRQGKYEQAEPLYQRALRIFEQGLGPEHPETASTLHQLASLYQEQGKYEQAEPLYQRALAIREQQLGPKHLTTARTLHELARLLVEQGKYEQAEPLFQRVLAIREKVLGSDHPDTVTARKNYHALVEDMKRKGKGQH